MLRRVLFCLFTLLVCSAATNSAATKRLLEAVEGAHADAIVSALAEGADPNALTENKTPALVAVVTKSIWGHEQEVIAAFVKAKADLNAADADGATALMAAAATDADVILEALLAAGAKVDARDHDGWTAVHYATVNGNWQSLNKLIAAKANLDIAASDQYTALMMAIGSGRGNMAEKLINAGAKFPTAWPGGSSTLLHATSGRDLESVRIALAHNPKLNEPYAKDGSTPLIIAAWNGDAQIVMELLRAGADPSIKDKEGKTALDNAVEAKEPEIAALLGGKWDKPQPNGGKTISIPCEALGGTVESNIAVDGKALVLMTTFPHPVTYYLGGDKSFTPTYSFDNSYSVFYDQYGTTVVLHYTNSKGEEKTKHVYGNVLDVNVKKGSEDVSLSDLGEDAPQAENLNGVLRSRVPLSLLALKPGSSVKVTAKIGSCKPVVEKIALK